ncbi:hypothetical protein QBC47DRAFT_304575 [Echria macrotheca]|uniref:2EXR domain-containing protein n=1 Tax=Echria macrotheca TaxID=438768 RepID=A0AAJ0BA25_9PEZI|nr:hypothetical protein QBC47DRAFT_304575 [Echria macrotheca]
MSFPQFSLLPGELRNQIWDHASASPTPQIHFLHRTKPRSPQWIDWDMLLTPDRESGARNQVSLGLTCRDARAALLRRFSGLDNNSKSLTLLRVSALEAAAADKTVRVRLDLGRDVICFGSPDAGPREADEALDWGEWSHLVFSTARKFAVRYQGRYGSLAEETPASRYGQHLLWPDCLHLARLRPGQRQEEEEEEETPMCTRCVANVMRRFVDLREFWLIVDGCGRESTGEIMGEVLAEDEGVGLFEESGKAKRPREFQSFGRTYFEVVAPEERIELQGPMEALAAIRNTLVCSLLCFGDRVNPVRPRLLRSATHPLGQRPSDSDCCHGGMGCDTAA